MKTKPRKGTLTREAGQALVEFLIVVPVMLALILGAVQFALLYHAKTTLNYAAFEAVRAGTLNHASFAAVKSGFARGLAPLHSYSKDDTDQVGAFKTARKMVLKEFDDTRKLIRIERLSPSLLDFQEFGIPGRDDQGKQIRLIPNDNLRYRSSERMKKSHSTIQDANLLHLRVTYWYPLYVPLLNDFIYSLVCNQKGVAPDAACDPNDPRFPLTATAAMRMQSAVYEDNAFTTNQKAGN
jgi:hypothetical protein